LLNEAARAAEKFKPMYTLHYGIKRKIPDINNFNGVYHGSIRSKPF